MTLTKFASIAAAICLLPLTVSAQVSFITEVRVLVHDYDGLRENYFQNEPDLKVLTHSVENIATATSSAQLGFGYNKVSASFDAFNFDNPAGRMMANARTFWNDEVLIESPGLEGTLGTFTASLRVEGTAEFNMDGVYTNGDPYSDAGLYGFWDAWIGTSTDQGGSYLVGGWFGDWYSDEFGVIWYTGDDLTQPMTEVTLEFIDGQPFLLGGNLEAYFDAENPNLLSGTIGGRLDFSHSAYWDGISGFFNGSGLPVENITLNSRSGVDWRDPVNPVPEPASLAVLAIGIWAMARLQRTRI